MTADERGELTAISASGFVQPTTAIRVSPGRHDSDWELLELGADLNRIGVYARRADLRRIRDVIDGHLAREAGASDA